MSRSPRLLVSVRDADEARRALAGGADVIDVKEPSHGPLGRAGLETIREISEAVRDFRADGGWLTAALGEIGELTDIEEVVRIAACIDAAKVGLSACRAIDWQVRWRRLGDTLSEASATPLLAVAYADWQFCGAPPPEDVVTAAIHATSPGVLFDTYHKRGRGLLDCLPAEQLGDFVAQLHESQRFVALAGSLGRADLKLLRPLKPEIVAVRTAVCRGGRSGTVAADLVAGFRAELCEKLASSDSVGAATTRRVGVHCGPE